MRDSLLRVIDDLNTKHAVHIMRSKTGPSEKRRWNEGIAEALDYALCELRKVLDDHGKS